MNKQHFFQRSISIAIAFAFFFLPLLPLLAESEALTEVRLSCDQPDGATVESDSGERFQGVRKVVIADAGVLLNLGAFRNCTDLEEVELPEGLKRLPDEVFLGCSKLRKVMPTNCPLQRLICKFVRNINR